MDKQLQAIRDLYGLIESDDRTNLGRAIELGGLLSGAKKQHKHGRWVLWAKKNLPFSLRKAQLYMRLHERAEELKSANIALLTDAIHHVQTKAKTGTKPKSAVKPKAEATPPATPKPRNRKREDRPEPKADVPPPKKAALSLGKESFTEYSELVRWCQDNTDDREAEVIVLKALKFYQEHLNGQEAKTTAPARKPAA